MAGDGHLPHLTLVVLARAQGVHVLACADGVDDAGSILHGRRKGEASAACILNKHACNVRT